MMNFNQSDHNDEYQLYLWQMVDRWPHLVPSVRQQWVQDQSAELEEVLTEDLKMIAYRYGTQIKQCEQDLIAAQQPYEEGNRNWKEENQQPGGDLGDAA